MSEITRRAAIQKSALLVSPSVAFSYQANSAVSFGIIGTGGRGTYVGSHMTRDKNARLAAICDIYPDKIDAAKTHIPGAEKIPAYRDLNDLLAKPDIDAVLIATPVFLHPDHFVAAVKADKHIYCEKPAGADVKNILKLLKAGTEQANPKKTIQFGFQQRFSREYLRAKAMVETGAAGDMKVMMSYWILGGTPPTGFQSKYPEGEQKIRHWGWFMETSGGPIIEQDCHGIDTLNWFAADQHPMRAAGTGGLRYPLAYGNWTTDHQNITYYYPNGLEGYLISIKHTAGYRDVREQFYGSKAVLETGRTYFRHHGPLKTAAYPNADDLRDRSLIEKQESPREITIDAVESFFQSIVDRKPYNMTKTSAESTLTALLGRMAVEQKREVTWDELLRS